MADVELPRRTIGSSTRLTPEEIVNRGFANAFRGISETEVRNFLKRVADEFGALRDRERELAARVEQLEDRLRNPPPPTEQQLLDSLGEETARVLRSAQEAGDDIRRKAEERAAALQQESQEEAERLRETTEAQCGALRREAEEGIAARRADVESELAALRTHAETEIGTLRDEAEHEAETVRETARNQGRDMVAEAFAVRERVLTDLSRRRATLQAQVDALRTGRDALLDAYRVVHRTLVEAADALSNAEGAAALAAASQETEAAALDTDTTAVESAVFAAVARAESAPQAPEPGTDVASSGTATAPEPSPGEHAPGPERDLRDVDALFARLRAGREDAAAAGVPAHDDLPPEAVARNGKSERHDLEAGAAASEEPPERNGDAAVVRERDLVLDRLQRDLVRKVKRHVQDEQNELLDELRKQRGGTTPDKVLPALDDQIGRWTDAIRPGLDAAASSAAIAVTGTAEDRPAPDELVDELVRGLALPLRERVYDALLDESDDEVTQRVNARYREWKTGVEAAVGDALVAVWGRGTVDAAPEGSLLRWIPEQEGRCADCDDNALEPTARGEAFPTGQAHPPAHPGCRCVLAVVVEAGAAPGGLEPSRT